MQKPRLMIFYLLERVLKAALDSTLRALLHTPDSESVVAIGSTQ